MRLSPYERLNLLNQFLILKKIDDLEEGRRSSYFYNIDDLEPFIDTLACNNEGLFDKFFDYLEGSSVPKSVAVFVDDVLKMYDRGYSFYKNLTANEKKEFGDTAEKKRGEERVIFYGFDGNEEGSYYSTCNLIVNTYKEHPDVHYAYNSKKYPKDVDSHAHMVGKYKEQLDKYNKYSGSSEVLTLKELQDIF